MQDQPNVAVERAVLGLVLDAYPKSLTIPEVARQIGGEAVESAVRDLVGVGLLECQGDLIRPTAAALQFDQLELP
ncbi:MAG TPA: hypothetical protein VIS51_02775 [Solirubrobacterales bacterium]